MRIEIIDDERGVSFSVDEEHCRILYELGKRLELNPNTALEASIVTFVAMSESLRQRK